MLKEKPGLIIDWAHNIAVAISATGVNNRQFLELTWAWIAEGRIFRVHLTGLLALTTGLHLAYRAGRVTATSRIARKARAFWQTITRKFYFHNRLSTRTLQSCAIPLGRLGATTFVIASLIATTAAATGVFDIQSL